MKLKNFVGACVLSALVLATPGVAFATQEAPATDSAVTTTEGTAAEGTATEGTATEGTVTEGTVTEGTGNPAGNGLDPSHPCANVYGTFLGNCLADLEYEKKEIALAAELGITADQLKKYRDELNELHNSLSLDERTELFRNGYNTHGAIVDYVKAVKAGKQYVFPLKKNATAPAVKLTSGQKELANTGAGIVLVGVVGSALAGTGLALKRKFHA